MQTPFIPGNKLGQGRPKGSINKGDLVLELRAHVKTLGIDAVKAFWGSWQQITDPIEKARLAVQFMEFLYPKLRHHQLEMSPEQAVIVLQEAIDAGRTTVDIEPIPEPTTGTDEPV